MKSPGDKTVEIKTDQQGKLEMTVEHQTLSSWNMSALRAICILSELLVLCNAPHLTTADRPAIDRSLIWHLLQNILLRHELLFSVIIAEWSTMPCVHRLHSLNTSKRPWTTCVPQEVPMQSCIWQHLRASFFHTGFNLICCQRHWRSRAQYEAV